ncbi:MAG: hypothetical protein DRJ07_17785, partial [Bacteroidetes bacterium]
KIAAIIISSSIIIAVWGFNFPLFEEDYWFNYITDHFNSYTEKIPQQKVYLQLDHDEYMIGSTIWYKAYVLNSKEQKPDTLSRNLYVELISPEKEIFMYRLLKLENGLGNGDFPMHDTLATGNYLIRAYTRNMKNYGKDYLFSKEIRIINPKKLYYSKEIHKKAKKIKNKSENIDLQFFPEGGVLVKDINSKLAFKAINTLGLGIDVEGKIFTKKGKEISSFKSSHSGMGIIEFTPEKELEYYAVINKPEGIKTKYQIPQSIKNGYVISINNEHEKNIKIQIKTNKKFSNDKTAKTIYLFAQSGGKIYYKSRLLFEKNEINLKIQKNNIPTGIVHFTLFDGHGKPQCERLAFVNRKDFLDINIHLNKKSYKTREKVILDINIKDKKGLPVRANVSIAVRNKTRLIDIPKNKANIISSLFLQADIQGNIEDQEYYFTDTKKAKRDLDILLLTQAWRKFNWDDILQDSIASPEFIVEKDISISGRITKYLFNISAKNASVELTFLNKFNDVYKTICDNKGRFSFDGLDYNDTLDVLLEFRSHVGRKNIMAILDEDRDIGITFSPLDGFYLDSCLVKHKVKYLPGPVEEEKDPNVPEDFKLHRQADQVVKFDEPHYSSYQSVMDALKGKVPGLSIGQNSSMIRGPKSLTLSNEPLYLVDGMVTTFDGIQSISVNDVDRVEILKGPSAAIYGSRGGNGVIAVYTKKGYYYKRGELRFKMLGYHTPKTFYVPKYDIKKGITNEKKDYRKTVYWKPNVKTDKTGKAYIEFYQSDISDEFEIVIEGISVNGKIGSFSSFYTVKKR